MESVPAAVQEEPDAYSAEAFLDEDGFDDGEVPCWAKYLPDEPVKASVRA